MGREATRTWVGPTIPRALTWLTWRTCLAVGCLAQPPSFASVRMRETTPSHAWGQSKAKALSAAFSRHVSDDKFFYVIISLWIFVWQVGILWLEFSGTHLWLYSGSRGCWILCPHTCIRMESGHKAWQPHVSSFKSMSLPSTCSCSLISDCIVLALIIVTIQPQFHGDNHASW